MTDLDDCRDLRVLFCGMTRATVRLEILCRDGNPLVGERLLANR